MSGPGRSPTTPTVRAHALRAVLGAFLLAGFFACEQAPGRSKPGDSYRELARPEVWKLVPHQQAELLGLEPGDLLLRYGGEPVLTNADVVAAQERAASRGQPVIITVLRDGRELEFEVEPGPIGVLPVSMHRPSSLAAALADIMRSLGLFAEYDWLAALTGESFTLAAADEECRAWWPAGTAGLYLDDLALMTGLDLHPVYLIEEGGDALAAVRGALEAGHPVLVRGGWPMPRAGFWGVATGFDPEQGERGLLFGFTLDSAEEQPLAGGVVEAYVVRPGMGWDDLDEVLALVLTQALELGLSRIDFGWRTGLQAYDELITGLDTVPFCPVCGPEESPVCFERLVWAMVAHKESAVRFLEAMREVVPEEAALIDEIVGDLRAQVGKLEGIGRSGARIGVLEDQRRIAMALAEVQVIENDLLGLYEQLLSLL